jgi:hypothetical protein
VILGLDQHATKDGVGRYSATTFSTRLSDSLGILWAFENPGETLVHIVGIWMVHFAQTGTSAEALIGLHKTIGDSSGGAGLAQVQRIARGTPNRCRLRRPNAAEAGVPTAITIATEGRERFAIVGVPSSATAAGMLSDAYPHVVPGTPGYEVEPGYGVAARIDQAGPAGDRVKFTIVWDVLPREC